MGCLFSDCLKTKKNDDEPIPDIENQQKFRRSISSIKTEQQKKDFAYRLKELGNKNYKQKQYQKAIEYYSNAIELYPEDSIFFSNRAICAKFLKNWYMVIQDSQKAIQLDGKNYKAYNYLGVALIQNAEKTDLKENNLEMFDEGILKIQQSRQVYQEITAPQKQQQVVLNKLEMNLRRAKFFKWRKQDDKNKLKQRNALVLIEELMKQNQNQQNHQLNNNNNSDDQKQQSLSLDKNQNTEMQQIQIQEKGDSVDGVIDKSQQIQNKEQNNFNDQIDETNKLIIDERMYQEIKNEYILNKNPNFEQQSEIPQHYQCSITFNIMEDPVLSQAGFSYNKDILQEHFKKNGSTDPISRKEVNPNLIIPNDQLKRAIIDFKDKNPWHYEIDNFDDEDL